MVSFFRILWASFAIFVAVWTVAAAQDSPDSATIARQVKLRELSPKDTPELRGLGFDVLSFPRMDGSTSTQPLAALIACRCLGMDYQWVGSKDRLPLWVFPSAPLPEAEAKLQE